MKKLLIVTALIESALGILLLLSPSLPVSILFDTSVDSTAGLLLGRLAGAALFSLAIVCWLARNHEKKSMAMGIVTSMFVYNVAALGLLVYAGLGIHITGMGLWPAVFIHIFLGGWCLQYLLKKTDD